jgi:hypothetical protein
MARPADPLHLSSRALCRATNCPVAVTIEREFFGQCDVGNTARESIQMKEILNICSFKPF